MTEVMTFILAFVLTPAAVVGLGYWAVRRHEHSDQHHPAE